MMLGYLLLSLILILLIILISKEGRPPSPGAIIFTLMMIAGTVSAQTSSLSIYKVSSDYFVKPVKSKEVKMFVDYNRSSMFVSFPNNVKPVGSNQGTIFIQSTKNQSVITVYKPSNNYMKGSYNVRNVIKFK